MGKVTKHDNGKVKKKSIKANVTSKFSSKRKLSRMGKKVRKGKAGPNTEFITRSSALKRLQINLKDFRRLCILKGIFPRVPGKALNGKDKIYYDIKDISYIAHEPLLHKFREFKTFMKKIRKASGRNQINEARRKDDLKPQMRLDHLVKERYPRFIDALRDMDDALCMIHLFAALPSSGRILSKKTANCSELSRHWQYYVSESRTLRKVFVSVKGIYYQAEVMGETITWLVPHSFTQSLPKEVDIKVMMTFLEFYESFIRFVLFKLYNLQNMVYPPVLNTKMDQYGAYLTAVSTTSLDQNITTASNSTNKIEDLLQNNTNINSDSTKHHKIATSATVKQSEDRLVSLPKVLEKLSKKSDVETDDENDEVADSDDDELIEQELHQLSHNLNTTFNDLQQNTSSNAITAVDDDDDEERKTFALPTDDPIPNLFAKFTFFINREVPLPWLEFCAMSCGAKVGWEGENSPFKATDKRITHQIVDRPLQGNASANSSGREYIQPQWVFDCINAALLLPVTNYRPGSTLPPHLSPFVDDEKEGYLPQYREEIKKLKAAANPAATVATTDDVAESDAESDNSSDEEREEEFEQQLKLERAKKSATTQFDNAANNKTKSTTKSSKKAVTKFVESENESAEEEHDSNADHDSDEEQDAQEAVQHAQITSSTANTKSGKGVVFKPKEQKQTETAETQQLSTMMMTNKHKRLYGRMQNSIRKKQETVQTLQRKRKQIDSVNSDANAGVGKNKTSSVGDAKEGAVGRRKSARKQ